ncbi:hypothetical protein [Vibrio agarivorans]|uniref:Pilus assembly protein n=1 Tax=Vibrio agarivorans TaxID=153622 RepID=A0ABT7Y7D6_9VIBR|nr:hypothetical protein [Vibrio agarivorans]MDN2483973.1 hypothetical protein [Vibrio agarivorans]
MSIVKQRGLALVDIGIGMIVLLTALTLTYRLVYGVGDMVMKKYEIDNFAEHVFDGMEFAFWDNFAETRCLTPPTITLSSLESDRFIRSEYIEDTWFTASEASIEFVENPNSILPTALQIVVPIIANSKYAMNTKYSAGMDSSGDLILKRPISPTISSKLRLNMTSSGCDSL